MQERHRRKQGSVKAQKPTGAESLKVEGRREVSEVSGRTTSRRDCCTGSERVAGAFTGAEAQRPDLSDPQGEGDTRSKADGKRRPNTLQRICASSPTPRCFEAERRIPLLLRSNSGQLAPSCLLFPSTRSVTPFLQCRTKKCVQENTGHPQTSPSMLRDNEGNVLLTVLFRNAGLRYTLSGEEWGSLVLHSGHPFLFAEKI